MLYDFTFAMPTLKMSLNGPISTVVSAFRKKIAEKSGTEEVHLKMFHNGRELRDNETLEEVIPRTVAVRNLANRKERREIATFRRYAAIMNSVDLARSLSSEHIIELYLKSGSMRSAERILPIIFRLVGAGCDYFIDDIIEVCDTNHGFTVADETTIIASIENLCP